MLPEVHPEQRHRGRRRRGRLSRASQNAGWWLPSEKRRKCWKQKRNRAPWVSARRAAPAPGLAPWACAVGPPSPALGIHGAERGAQERLLEESLPPLGVCAWGEGPGQTRSRWLRTSQGDFGRLPVERQQLTRRGLRISAPPGTGCSSPGGLRNKQTHIRLKCLGGESLELAEGCSLLYVGVSGCGKLLLMKLKP